MFLFHQVAQELVEAAAGEALPSNSGSLGSTETPKHCSSHADLCSRINSKGEGMCPSLMAQASLEHSQGWLLMWAEEQEPQTHPAF